MHGLASSRSMMVAVSNPVASNPVAIKGNQDRCNEVVRTGDNGLASGLHARWAT